VNTRASNSILRAVRRRVERKPGAVLIESSVRRVPIPRTHFHATVFIYRLDGKHHFVAELVHGDLPHVYNTSPLANLKAFEISRALGETLTLLAHTATHDPRFTRSKIIEVNGFAPVGA
jgi:hypothetical protein